MFERTTQIPKRPHQIMLRVSDDEKAAVEEEARAQGCTSADVLREALEHLFGEDAPGDTPAV